ncbi:VOC family protein [Microlunatus sp. GCM10028923]|uniref:VOC family protein n=1 Tax=Microlunatus sp. GCM10028923 TaxID=3273400 RepID=UPI0036189FDC
MTRTSAESSVEIATDPETAFRIFTEEINLWWVRGPINHYDASRLAELRLEPGVGGRMLEIYDEASGDQLETARITTWQPGVLLVMRDSVQDTETEVRFEPAGGGTRVSVAQRLVLGGDPTGLGFGWVSMLPTFRAWTLRRDTAPREPRETGRLGIALYYKNPGTAARWLRSAFGLGSWDVDRVPEEGDGPGWIDLHIGDSLLILLPLRGERPPGGPVTHGVWVHVDDLEAHFARAKESGAVIISEIARHGSRKYVAEDPEGHRWTFVQARPTMR